MNKVFRTLRGTHHKCTYLKLKLASRSWYKWTHSLAKTGFNLFPEHTAPRQSRWGPRSTFTAPALASLNLAIEAPMTAEQTEAYALHVRISEITQKLEMDDIVPADPIRRPTSPTLEYDMSGHLESIKFQSICKVEFPMYQMHESWQ